jgi:hypothetical protein
MGVKTESGRKLAWKRGRVIEFLHDQGIKISKIAAEIQSRGGIEAVLKQAAEQKPRRDKVHSDTKNSVKATFRKVAKIIAYCERDECTRCGDACPVRATWWRRDNSPALSRLFVGGVRTSVQEFELRRTSWVQDKGHLADTSLIAVSKTLRRALDSLREPSLVAVGIIDAQWGLGKWHVGARVFVAVSPDVNLYRAFDHTKGIAGPLVVLPVPDVGVALKRLFRDAQVAKCTPWSDEALPKRSLRGEYYAWLAGLEPNARVFRYGCDRYFNKMKKTLRPIELKPKKRHPNPWWLEIYRYGNHPDQCDCGVCRGRQNT